MQFAFPACKSKDSCTLPLNKKKIKLTMKLVCQIFATNVALYCYKKAN